MFNKLTVFSLVTITVIVAAAIFANLRAPQTTREKPLFFPQLADSIEEVSHIRIQSFDDSINLSRKDNIWGVDEFDGYPALPDKVKGTVLGAADLKLNAPKTALERLYPRLGVEGPIADESTSRLLTLKDGQEQNIIDVIVGKPRRSSASQSTPGLYVRKAGDAQSYLVDGLLELSAKKTDWIERSLLDIPSEAIQRVSIKHTDGDAYTLYKSTKGQDSFELENLEEGQKAAPDILLNRFGAILADVQISSVRNKTAFADVDDRIAASIKTFDGLQVDMQAFSKEGRPYASFIFSIDTNHSDEEDADIDNDQLQQYVTSMNDKLGDWVFEIQGFKYDILTNRADDVVRSTKQTFSTVN